MSAVVFLVFFMTVFGGAWIWSLLSYLTDAIKATTLTNDATFNLLVWSWEVGVLILILFGASLWLLYSLQKSRYREVGV